MLSPKPIIVLACHKYKGGLFSAPNRHHTFELTLYQKAVLAGYITICFGFSLVDARKRLTNPLIFQATRSALKGLLKKKPAAK